MRLQRLTRHRDTALRLVGILSLFICCCLQVFAQNQTLKTELERTLVGKTVVSRIVLGGRATPKGLSADYPVNTLVDSDSGKVTYRIEWGFVRTEVGMSEMLRKFDSGTSFSVAGLNLKKDRIELKLKILSGQSLKVKLMLGKGWQSQFDVAAVRGILNRTFVLDGQTEQEQADVGESNQQEPSAQATAAPAPPLAPAGEEGRSQQNPLTPNSQPSLPQLQAPTPAPAKWLEEPKTLEFGETSLG